MKCKVIGVNFKVTNKRFYCKIKEEDNYKKDDMLIVETQRGKELGRAFSNPHLLDKEKLDNPVSKVLREASKGDIKNYHKLEKEAEEAFTICKREIKKHKLPMKLVASEYTLDRSKLIFYFTAEGRVDFRKLVKDLASIFKLRIELRQIGVRDEARILGDIGICGQEVCCKKFINNFSSVSIKMAREQGLIINPSKISGSCGRLLCCIKYESDQYEEALKRCPKLGTKVKIGDKKGCVSNLDPLNEKVQVKMKDGGIEKVDLDKLKVNSKKASKKKSNKKGNKK
ncbi:MAG: PSP1 domain-containing protein [Fusobacteriota bacterium]